MTGDGSDEGPMAIGLRYEGPMSSGILTVPDGAKPYHVTAGEEFEAHEDDVETLLSCEGVEPVNEAQVKALLAAQRKAREQAAAEETADDENLPEPWAGYNAMTAPEIVRALSAEDQETRDAVAAYERLYKNRSTVLAAAAPAGG